MCSDYPEVDFELAVLLAQEDPRGICALRHKQAGKRLLGQSSGSGELILSA